MGRVSALSKLVFLLTSYLLLLMECDLLRTRLSASHCLLDTCIFAMGPEKHEGVSERGKVAVGCLRVRLIPAPRRQLIAPALCAHPAPVPPSSYHRTMATALHLDALMLVTRLELLHPVSVGGPARPAAVRRRCPRVRAARRASTPRNRCYCVALLRTLWRLSYQEVHDWLCAWPAWR